MISSNSLPTSFSSIKNFSVGEFFKVSLEQYLLLRCSYLHQSLEETPKSCDRRQLTLEFLNEFMQFGKLVTGRPLKHCFTTIADIIERNIILDFSMLRKRHEKIELSGDTSNKSFKSLLLVSFDKMDMHVVQLFARLLCIRLMYERLAQAQKVPKGANYRDKFDNDLNKHIDQIKVLSSMAGNNNESDINMQISDFYSFLTSLSNRCELKETKKYIRTEYEALRERFGRNQTSNNLQGDQALTGNNRPDRQMKQLTQYQPSQHGFESSSNHKNNIKNEYQHANINDYDQLSNFQTPKQQSQQAHMLSQSSEQLQQSQQYSQSDKPELNCSDKRRLFTSIFIKNNGETSTEKQPLMPLSENKDNRRDISKGRFQGIQVDRSLSSRLIEEENSNNGSSQQSNFNNNTQNNKLHFHSHKKNNKSNNENNNYQIGNSNAGFESAHLEENTQFTLLDFKASQLQHQQAQQSQQLLGDNIINNTGSVSASSAVDFRDQKITKSLNFSSSFEKEKLPDKSIELIQQQQSSTDDQRCINNSTKIQCLSSNNNNPANLLSTTSALSKACTINQRQLTKPIQSGRTMYSQMNKKIIRNSQSNKHHGSSKNNTTNNNANNCGRNNSQRKNSNGDNNNKNKHKKDTNNILLEAAQLLLLEQDSRKQNKLKVMSRQSTHQHAELQLYNSASITKKAQNGNGFTDQKHNKDIPIINQNKNNNSHSEDESSLPLMYMWGHN